MSSNAAIPIKSDRRTITDDDIARWGGRYAPILFNAVRLLDDAKILRVERRYASAIGLAVLSLEETGKFVLSHDHFNEAVPSPVRRKGGSAFTHKQKQRAAAKMVSGVMGFHEIKALGELAGFKLGWVSVEAPKIPGPTEEDIISGIKDRAIENFIENSDFGAHLKFFVYLMKGKYDDIKQQCFYVDEHRIAEGISGPDRIDRDTCDGALRIAGKAIWATKTELRRYSQRLAGTS